MTKLEAFDEAARRCGEPPEKVQAIHKYLQTMNVVPPDGHEELPRGTEEAQIQQFQKMFQMTRDDPQLKAKAIEQGKAIMARVTKNN